ncbi:MAG: sugar phosphate isomerase/epimerase [Planctomycetes bacterium]|nr:sugar phosphate isomerase/epimerase [Planctomycetota bacterium]
MKTALHTVSYAGVWPGQASLSLERVIEKAAALGYDGLMLMAKRPHASVLDMDSEARRRIRGHLEERGLRLAIVAGYNDFSGGAETPDVPYREMQVHYIGELARLARDLGGDKVRAFTGFERPGLPLELQWGWCVACLKEAARRAADHGVTLCVQNHHDVAAHHESLLDLLEQVGEPSCKAAFDAWSPALQGADLAAAVARMAPWIAHTTVADYVRRPRFRYVPRLVNYERETDAVRAVPMGEGTIDYESFFEALRAARYDGWAAYEMCSPLRGGGSEENLDRCARRFIEWMASRGLARGPARG